jgi:serine beta-lactamase-like protein LACTB
MANMRRALVVLAVTAPFIGAAPSGAQQPALSVIQRQKIDSAIARYMHDRHVPGASVAIGLAGSVAYAKAYGLADLEHNVPVSTRTRFQSASTLKAITATAALILAERGRLNLDAPIQESCRTFPPKRWPVTPRLLFLHQGGIRPSRGADVFNRTHFPTVSDVVKRFADDTLVAEPGTREVYSNEGFTLLACAIEGASGRTYADFVRDAVLTPSGMESTTVDDVYAIVPDRARSYIVRTAENTRMWEGLWTPSHLAATQLDTPANADAVDPSWGWGAGNYLTTPTDLVRLTIALRGSTLLSDSTRMQMFTGHPTRDGKVGRGYGWVLATIEGVPSPRLVGSNWTGSSAIVMVPAWDLSVALSSNLEFEQPTALLNDIARIVRGLR